ncbi:gephyrin-like molybdotransferase Glp [uncultured Roseovarius sp.]|uniref:molybdopterin molybdotransferase MoeA n=1 Tax=uncultured Roseovarius sp. TaxID=293344 RepID=UPI0025ECF63E|nr:gephyrin-like molybdotransferase Glp [uncultured Roseovarius sp.]
MTIISKITTRGCGCDAPEETTKLISIDAALARIDDHATPLVDTEVIPLSQALGRVLAAPVRAADKAPAFNSAAMDGYAVNTTGLRGDGPWIMPVIDHIAAGAMAKAPLAPVGAARILTGAPLPEGADAVIRQEDVIRQGATVRLDMRPKPGENIRQAGEEMQQGQTILSAGCRLGPRQIAASAACGAASLRVRRTLRIALVVTGSEVRAPGRERTEGQIWDVNTPMLQAALAGPELDLILVEHLKDDPDLMTARLAELAKGVDLIVTTGGVSVGDADHVKPALIGLGAEVHFSGVAIKPGKPVSYGSLAGCHWLGLPGNPAAAFVTWQVFGTRLIHALTGQESPRVARRHVVTADAINRKPGRCELRPAKLVGFDDRGREVSSCASASHSARASELASADGLIFLPAESDHLPAGALVEFSAFCDS